MPQIYHSQSLTEFLDNVRFQAASKGAPWQLIDKLDEVREALVNADQTEELEKVQRDLETANNERGEALEALRDLLDALPDNAAEMLEDLSITKLIENAKRVLIEQNG